MYDDQDDLPQLENLLRNGLRAHASEVQPLPDLAASARHGARQRRRSRLGVLAAAVALVAIPGAIWATDGRRDPATADPADTPVATGPAQPSAAVEAPDDLLLPETEREIPDGWRVESYHNVQLRVPPSWGWGASPMVLPSGGSGETFSCGGADYPVSQRATAQPPQPSRGYVGRPVMLSDVCTPLLEETVPHVWFDSPQPTGVERLENGLQRVTVAVGGMRVSVADTDFAELGLILDSVAAGSVDDNGCVVRPRQLYEDQPGAADVLDLAAAAGPSDFGGMAVCAYDVASGTGATHELVYSTTTDGDAERLFLQRLGESPDASADCPPVEGQPVVLQPQIAASTPQIAVRLDSCGPSYGPVLKELTVGNVEPWAVHGISTYVNGAGLDGPVADFFAVAQG